MSTTAQQKRPKLLRPSIEPFHKQEMRSASRRGLLPYSSEFAAALENSSNVARAAPPAKKCRFFAVLQQRAGTPSELPQALTAVPARATRAEIVRAQISSGDPVAATGNSRPSFP